MADTKVYILDGGRLAMKEYHMYWNAGGEAMVTLPCYSVLIEHDDGRFLFDTGFDLHHFDQFVMPGIAQQSLDQTIPGQLANLGLSPADITHVINSHYHIDHCGGNKHCLHATTICHACELEAARTPEPFEELAYSDQSFAPGLRASEPEIDIYTPRFETLTGDQEIARGVFLFETPGHTNGHYSLMIKLSDRRPMMFTADAAYTARSMETRTISSAHVDPVAACRSLERLNILAQDHDAELFYGHDIEQFGAYRIAPAYYS
ncbi:4-pyridoxolactonase [Sphingobium phenoxybenzoativorans]|uniref:4-pyridoxolactonase n=1 Tax=Sphingobium phenoxybenzoativorans TaxID=1592790 RepID=UPI000872B0CD|nr:N-acyl homoserine lactonase family protein [Sphingobium phenoxybenzoativorans]